MSSVQDELFKVPDSTPDTVDSVAFGRINGEPLFNIPHDLYIPPDALEIFLEAFEGPLDLLLYLIRKQGFDILTIPMAEVTDQYLKYVYQIREHNLELAADYLLMAAQLIDIKARMLLPREKTVGEEEEDDPRADIIRRLLEYEQMKLAAQQLNELPQLGRDYQKASAFMDLEAVERLPQVNAEDLKQTWLEIIKRAQLNKKHQITREQLSVREHMSQILRKLSQVKFIEFSELFMDQIREGAPVAVVVVHFIAMLELAKESLLNITQAQAYAPIYVRLAYHSHATTTNLELV
ncbi:segregation and condensation protein A [Basilea psittacipulmonis]|uniref:segregation and condensation protein A n=1 Tax=Basilea psittacipulmonis TaxID=1472345 RepID=UPI001F2623D0|nr:ScpA family protein [Basilea psittacipulmonis]